METINIKNVSVQPSIGPAVPMRIIKPKSKADLAGTQEGDIVNASALLNVLSDSASAQPGIGFTGNDSTVSITLLNKVGGTQYTSVVLPMATNTKAGVLGGTDKAKLDGVQANANNYTLPAATASALGGVKKAAALADLAAGADLAAVITGFNSLLAKLRTAGILS